MVSFFDAEGPSAHLFCHFDKKILRKKECSSVIHSQRSIHIDQQGNADATARAPTRY